MRKRAAIFIISILFLLCGCTQGGRIQNNLSDIGIRELYEFEDTSISNEARAEAIREALEEIPEVKSAAVVISGKTALIGIQLDITEREEVARVKAEAAKRAHRQDKDIHSTAITSNSEITEMIRNMAEEKGYR